MFSGLGGLQLLAAELGSLAGRGEGEFATGEGETGVKSARESQGKSPRGVSSYILLAREETEERDDEDE